MTINSCNERKESDNLKEALEDNLKVWINKSGEQVAEIDLLQASNTKLFTDLESKDSTIVELQEEVRKSKKELKNGGSVTIVEAETKIDTVFIPTESKIYTSLFAEPITSGFNDDWVDISFGVSLDSINDSAYRVSNSSLDLSIKNKYVVNLSGSMKDPKVKVRNLNPYTETTALRAFRVINNTKFKRIELRGFAGPGLLLKSNGTPDFGLAVGYGITLKF